MVGFVANNGNFDSDAALKGAHFVHLASERRVPGCVFTIFSVLAISGDREHLYNTKISCFPSKLVVPR